MPRAFAIELALLLVGLGITVAVFATAIWAYPQARREFELVGAGTFVVVAVMGVRPLRKAWRTGQAAR
jgi:hypothetical protein